MEAETHTDSGTRWKQTVEPRVTSRCCVTHTWCLKHTQSSLLPLPWRSSDTELWFDLLWGREDVGLWFTRLSTLRMRRTDPEHHIKDSSTRSGSSCTFSSMQMTPGSTFLYTSWPIIPDVACSDLSAILPCQTSCQKSALGLLVLTYGFIFALTLQFCLHVRKILQDAASQLTAAVADFEMRALSWSFFMTSFIFSSIAELWCVEVRLVFFLLSYVNTNTPNDVTLSDGGKSFSTAALYGIHPLRESDLTLIFFMYSALCRRYLTMLFESSA